MSASKVPGGRPRFLSSSNASGTALLRGRVASGVRGAHACWRSLPEGLRTLLLAAGFLLLALLAWAWYFHRYRLVAITDPDAEDYAQVALQLFVGRGLGSRVMPLCGLEYLRQTGGDPAGGVVWPNLHRFPFMPLVEWALFQYYGPTDRALSTATGIFFIASVPLVFLLGRRVFGPTVGALGACLFLLSPLALGASISGLTEQAATFFLLATVLLLTQPRSRAVLALAGILWGISFWNRYNGLSLALPFAIYLWAQDRKRAPGNLAAFLIPMLAAMAPEMVRNYRLAGDPLFSLTAALMVPYKSEVARPVHWWYVPVYVKPTHVLLAWPWAMLSKWGHEFYSGWRLLPMHAGHAELFPFVLLAFLLRSENDAQHRLRLLVLGLVGIHFLTLPFLSNIVRYYVYLSPLLILLATWSLLTLLHRLGPLLAPAGITGARLAGHGVPWPGAASGPRSAHDGNGSPRDALLEAEQPPRTRLIALLGVLALSGSMVVGWIDFDGPRPKLDLTRTLVDTWRSHMKVVREAVPDDAVVVCNAPWSIAWRADRKSVPLPASPALVPMLVREYGLNVGAIYLTPRRIGSWETPQWGAWESVRLGLRKVPGFRVERRFRDGALLLVRDGKPATLAP